MALDGPVIRQVGQMWAVMVYALWEHQYRPALATALGIAIDDVKVDALGDLRHMRNDIVHCDGTAGFVVGVVDWPLRLVVLPAAAATALTQISPDGRSLPRHLLSLARVRVAGRRRLGQALPAAGQPRRLALRVAVAADVHRPALCRARITGPCRLTLAEPVLIVRGRRGVRLVPVAARNGGVA